MTPAPSRMPALIVCATILGFYSWGSFIMWVVFLGEHPADPKAFSILDMYIVASIGLTTGGVGYWLGTTHNSTNKDVMLYNSTATPVPTTQTVTSTVTSESVPEPEPKP